LYEVLRNLFNIITNIVLNNKATKYKILLMSAFIYNLLLHYFNVLCKI